MKAVFVSSYAPVRCGFASFTADLLSGMRALGVRCSVVASGDPDADYREPVGAVLRADNTLEVAEYVNQHDFAVIHHEFGLFRNVDIGLFLRAIKIPYALGLHTITHRHNLRPVLDSVRANGRLVTTSVAGQVQVRKLYGVETQVVPLCVRVAPFVTSRPRVIASFGLLSPVKNIQCVLNALPQVLEEHPDVVFKVFGVDHPSAGSAYREALQERVCQRGLTKHVQFHDAFVDDDVLYDNLLQSSVVALPHLDLAQVSSSTLMHALACGNVVVATPFAHATEMLSGGRGFVIPQGRWFGSFNNNDVARTFSEALRGDRAEMRRAAYDSVQDCLPERIARRYLDVIAEPHASVRAHPEDRRDQPGEQPAQQRLQDVQRRQGA